MNVLDENLPLDQRDLLRAWGIACRMIGHDIARLSISDDNILAMLPRLKQPTLFTRDEHFFKRPLCHRSYGLIWLDVAPDESATFTRRLLQHPHFSTKARRMGLVLRAHHDGLQFWQWQQPALQRLRWIGG